MGSCMKISGAAAVVVSLLMIIIGICILVVVIPNQLEKSLKESLPYRDGEDSGKRFVESPVPGHAMFYIFNVTNKDKVNNGEEKIKFQQLGPYVYKQDKTKINVNWTRTDGSVYYNEKTVYTFDPARSNGKLTDVVNHINVLSMGLIPSVALITSFDPKVTLETLPGDFIDTHTVDELLFGGYDAKPYVNSTNDFVNNFIKSLMPPDGKFSLYGSNNNSVSREYQVATGTKELKDIGKIISYFGKPNVSVWFGEYCNAINGSDGKQFSPGTDKDSTLYVFSSDVCRSFQLKYQRDEVVEKIDTLRFTILPELFADPNKNEDNMCFCQRNPGEKKCPSKAGVFSVEKCQLGKPIAMSAPHFYLGEQEYRDNFEGLQDKADEHQTFLNLEPLTGTALSAAKRLQVNVIAVPNSKANFMKPLKKDMYIPIMWLEEGARIDEKSAEEFRSKVTTPYYSSKWGMVALIAIGGVVLLLVVVIACFKKAS